MVAAGIDVFWYTQRPHTLIVIPSGVYHGGFAQETTICDAINLGVLSLKSLQDIVSIVEKEKKHDFDEDCECEEYGDNIARMLYEENGDDTNCLNMVKKKLIEQKGANKTESDSSSLDSYQPYIDKNGTQHRCVGTVKSGKRMRRRICCQLCNGTFLVTSMDGHLRSKHRTKKYKDKEFKCNKCGQSFAKKGTLQDHLRLHDGVKRYECMICNKRFRQRQGLSAHLKRHQ